MAACMLYNSESAISYIIFMYMSFVLLIPWW